jgi:hypothetical protein
VAPYVDEEVAWAIRYHQPLRYFADESVGYQYPEAYKKYFGADYERLTTSSATTSWRARIAGT